MAAAKAADAKGIEVLGYVNCNGGFNDLKDAEAELSQWRVLYGLGMPLKGIFFDNQSPVNDARLDAFSRLYRSARSAGRSWSIVACTGYAACVEECLSRTGADILCKFADTPDVPLNGWELKYPPSRFALMLRKADDSAQVPAYLEQAAALHFGWVYVTGSEGLPERSFEFLPPYLAEEMASLRRLNDEIRETTVKGLPGPTR